MKLNTIYLSFLFLILSCILSCKPKEATPLTELHDAVMSVHDEVMPKMKDIYKLKKKLKNIDNSKLEASQSSKIQSGITALESADKEMMDWMAAYKKPKEMNDVSMSYLKDQQKKVDLVKFKMNKAIEDAQNILDAQ